MGVRRIGPASVPPLVAALSSADPRLRARAAAALGSGAVALNADAVERAKRAVPPLLAALMAPERDVRLFAAQSLGDIGRARQSTGADLGGAWAEVPRALGRCLRDTNTRVRERAAWALMWLGPEARPAIDALKAVAQDDDERVREWVTRALKQLAEHHVG